MRLPSLSELQKHLQTTLVVNAEVQYLAAGGKLGAQLASLITGTNFEEGTLPTDAFDDASISTIPIDHLSIYRCVVELRQLLESRSLGYGADSEALDSDFIAQEYLDFLELHLSALPEMTYGGYDWGGCRFGAMRDLLLAGRAWHRLVSIIDLGSAGDFHADGLTATDLALIADIELRSLRNLVGPNKKLRSQEHYQKASSNVGVRGFATINSFDALDWLVQRKGFAFAPVKAGLFVERLDRISDPIARGRAALIASFVFEKSFLALAEDLQEEVHRLRELADGQCHYDFAERVARHVMEIDKRWASKTAPA